MEQVGLVEQIGLVEQVGGLVEQVAGLVEDLAALEVVGTVSQKLDVFRQRSAGELFWRRLLL